MGAVVFKCAAKFAISIIPGSFPTDRRIDALVIEGTLDALSGILVETRCVLTRRAESADPEPGTIARYNLAINNKPP